MKLLDLPDGIQLSRSTVFGSVPAYRFNIQWHVTARVGEAFTRQVSHTQSRTCCEIIAVIECRFLGHLFRDIWSLSL